MISAAGPAAEVVVLGLLAERILFEPTLEKPAALAVPLLLHLPLELAELAFVVAHAITLSR